MRALLDVNVLVALFDEEHLFNERAHAWLESECQDGWASCPLTENGLVRILCHPNYSRTLSYSAVQVLEIFDDFVCGTDHEFWPDDVSLRNSSVFAPEFIFGPRLITDIYLLGLATRHKSRLVTFDEGINLAAIVAAAPENLCVIE